MMGNLTIAYKTKNVVSINTRGAHKFVEGPIENKWSVRFRLLKNKVA